jgi:hypothetical protein
LENASQLLSSGLDVFFSKGTSIGSGSPIPPSRKSVKSLMKQYEGIKDDESYAILDVLERISTKKDGVIRIKEDNVAKFYRGNENVGNWPEAIVEKRNGTLVGIEVKNQFEPDIGNAIKKFENISNLSKAEKANNSKSFGAKQFSEFILYVNKDKFRKFNDTNYTIGKGNILLLNGKPRSIDGKTIQVKMTDFKPS